MQKKDWRSVLEEAKNKVQLDWGQQQDIQEDQDFKAMWKEIGGDKIDKIPAKKSVNVQINQNTQQNTNSQKKEVAMA